MPYSESELDFFNFVINSLSSKSESDDSDFSSVFINLDICIFLSYIYTLLNKLADDFFINIHNGINSYLRSIIRHVDVRMYSGLLRHLRFDFWQ